MSNEPFIIKVYKNGLKGPPGSPGTSANLEIGSVTTVDPDQPADAIISGTSPNLVLDLHIPKGDKGDKGNQGDSIKGDKGDKGDDGITGASYSLQGVYNPATTYLANQAVEYGSPLLRYYLPVGAASQTGNAPTNTPWIPDTGSNAAIQATLAADRVANQASSLAIWGASTTTTLAGYINVNTGAFVANAAWSSRKVIIDDTILGLRGAARVSNALTALVTYFKADNTYLGYQFQGTATPQVYATTDFTIPPDAIGGYAIITGTTPAAITVESNVVQPVASQIAGVLPKVSGYDTAVSSLTTWDAATGTAHNGFYINRTTGAQTAGNWNNTIFALTGTEKSIRASALLKGNATALAVYYDGTGTYISYELAGPASGTDPRSAYVLSPPSNARSVGVTGDPSSPVTLEILVQQTDTASRIKTNEAQITTLNGKITVYDEVVTASSSWADAGGVVTAGAYINRTNGLPTSNAGWKYLTVPLTGSEEGVRATAGVKGTSTALAVYLDAGGAYISSEFTAPSNSVTTYTDQALNPPANARVVLITGDPASPMNVEIYSVQPVADIVLDHESRLEVVEAAGNDAAQAVAAVSAWADISAVWTNGYFYYSTGVINNSTFWKYTQIDMPADDTRFRVTLETSGNVTAAAVYFNSSGGYLGYELRGGTTTDVSDYELNIPTGTARIGITNHGSFTPSIQQYGVQALGGQITNLIDRVNILESGGNNFWYGKTAVWFGTSIPAGAGSNSPGTYVQRVADALGMTITNEAVGTSMCRAGLKGQQVPTSGPNVNDPYGWIGRNYRNVAWSLAGTLAEKQHLFDNWSYYRPLLFDDGGGIPTDPTTAKAFWDACSYENKLVAKHLGTNRKDVYFFDHGHNDSIVYTDINTRALASDSQRTAELVTVPGSVGFDAYYDRFYFVGAMNFLIDLIWKDNFRARIVLIGHYDPDRKPWVRSAQTIVQGLWSLPLVKTWEKLRWSQNKVVINGVTKTITQLWLPDDLHPHTDTSGQALDRYGEVLAAEIRNIV